MIQEIEPHIFDNSFCMKKASENDKVLIYLKNKVLLKKENNKIYFPEFYQIEEYIGDIYEKAEYCFSVDMVGYYLYRNLEIKEFEGFKFYDIKILRESKPKENAFIAITGSQIYRWKENRKFCGKCGGEMENSICERALICKKCGQIEYPKISPAIIVAIINKDKLLVTRYANRSYTAYALVAGFVEIGETFEETVKREVMEEVGLRVKNITYYKSQPWAFSDSQMIGFFAELDGNDKITLDENELSEGKWIKFEEIQEAENEASIGQELMKVIKNGEYKKYLK